MAILGVFHLQMFDVHSISDLCLCSFQDKMTQIKSSITASPSQLLCEWVQMNQEDLFTTFKSIPF